MMIRAGLLIVTLFATAASATASVPAPPTQLAQRSLITWTARDIRCDGQSITPVVMVRPQPGLGWQMPQTATVDDRFRIDASGRPLSITRSSPAFRVGATDIEPSLAVARFAAGAPKADCTISYAARATAIPQSAPADLAAYAAAPVDGQLPLEGWQHIRPTARDCLATPRPAPLLRAFPDFDRIAARPGIRDWSMIGFDLDKRGRPVRTSVAFGSGNAALNAAAVRAVRRSRFTLGARAGCVYPYWRNAASLVAPPASAVASLRPAGARCAEDSGWASPPALIYPQSYRRRAIEGWAVIGFDVAPWGETGNLHVLASEPAAAFGEQAVQMLRGARKAVSPLGRSGCVEMVRFVMVDRGGGWEPATD